MWELERSPQSSSAFFIPAGVRRAGEVPAAGSALSDGTEPLGAPGQTRAHGGVRAVWESRPGDLPLRDTLALAGFEAAATFRRQ